MVVVVVVQTTRTHDMLLPARVAKVITLVAVAMVMVAVALGDDAVAADSMAMVAVLLVKVMRLLTQMVMEGAAEEALEEAQAITAATMVLEAAVVTPVVVHHTGLPQQAAAVHIMAVTTNLTQIKPLMAMVE